MVTSVICASRLSSSPQLVGLSDSVQSDFVVSVYNGANNIVVTWRSRSTGFQFQSVQVMVTSECLTGIVVPQTQVFTVTPDVGSSVNARGLGKYLNV